jgi:hypothetical protein
MFKCFCLSLEFMAQQLEMCCKLNKGLIVRAMNEAHCLQNLKHYRTPATSSPLISCHHNTLWILIRWAHFEEMALWALMAQLHANHEKLWQIEEAYAIFKRAPYDEMQLHRTMESVLSQGWWSVDTLLHLGAIQDCNVASLDM